MKRIYNFISTILIVLALPCIDVAWASKLNNPIVLSGWLSLEKAKAIENELVLSSQNTIYFTNCTGGALVAALHLAKIIRKYKIKTVAEGNCGSACALAFLHGFERKIQGSGTAYLLLHGPSVPTGAAPEDVSKVVENMLRETTQNKLSAGLLDLIMNSRGRDQGVVLVSENAIFGRHEYAVHCTSGQLPNIRNCQNLGRADFNSLGVVD